MSETAPTEDVLVRVSAEAAEEFTEAYYNALCASRDTLWRFYVDREILPDGHKIPNIGWNGNDYDDSPEFCTMFQEEMPFTYFDIQNLDCHVINPNYSTESGKKATDKEKTMSILILVSGIIRLEDRKEGPQRQFTESFTIVPNVDKDSKGKGGKKYQWLIQAQNFRYVICKYDLPSWARM